MHRLRWLLLLALFGCDVLVPPLPVDPVPSVDPIASGLRVLIVEEGQRRDLLTAGQRETITSAPFRAWLADHSAELRIWDKDVDASRDSAEFQEMLSRPRSSVPWIVVTGRRTISQPLPSTLAETQSIIQGAK